MNCLNILLNKKFIKALNQAKNNKKGMTLVELIVSFALLGIFITSATLIISNITKTYYRVKSMEQGQQVTTFVMDKIVGQLSKAQVGIRKVVIDNDVEGNDSEIIHTMKIMDGGGKIDFYDNSGNHVYINLNDKKYLNLYYYEVSSTTDEELLQKIITYEAVNWTYDEKSYMGYEITNLSFSQPKGEYPENIIKVDLSVQNKKNHNQSFSTTRYIECYNFNTSDKCKLIGVE